MYILVTPPVNDRQKEKLREAAKGHEMVFCRKRDVTEEMLQKAEIILGNLKDPAQLKACRNLKWIQLNNAGTEGYCEPGILPEGAVLTNASGAYGLAISEHMIGCLFELRKKLHLYAGNQLLHRWKSEGFVNVIEGSQILVVGLGDIGMAFGRKMKALGCSVKGIRRHMGDAPEWLDGLYPMEELDSLLPEADVVAMSLPGNPSTYHVMDERRIGLLKESAVIPVSYTHLDVYKRQFEHHEKFHQEMIRHVVEMLDEEEKLVLEKSLEGLNRFFRERQQNV